MSHRATVSIRLAYRSVVASGPWWRVYRSPRSRPGLGETPRWQGFEFKGEAETIHDATTRLTELVTNLAVPLGERTNLGYPHMILGRST